MRVIVTGPRVWTDEYLVAVAFDEIALVAVADPRAGEPVTIVHGGAGGLDKIAHAEAKRRGWETETVLPDYGRYPPYLAPLMRNQEMVDRGAYAALVFQMMCTKPNCRRKGMHYTHGTTDCRERAERAGIPVWRYNG